MGHTVIISNNFGIDTAEAQSDKSGSYINNTKIFWCFWKRSLCYGETAEFEENVHPIPYN